MSGPRLSICIPTFNRAEFLSATLASIGGQAESDLEIVISDNASTDDTGEVVESFAKAFPRLVYFRHSSNVGADRNYLKAVDLASGEYCWLFGSDDVMLPGAIKTVTMELSSAQDIYLCGLMLCTRDLEPIAEHHILRYGKKLEFDLSDPVERLDYFRRALTTTAFFSFLGSVIVNRRKWNTAGLDEQFVGTLWIHVTKCLRMLPLGLRLKFIAEPLLLKRGDNDSFMDQGLVERIGISVLGYLAIGTHYFGADSPELAHIKRTLRYEWPLKVYVTLRDQLDLEDDKSRRRLDEIFQTCFDGNDIGSMVARGTYRSGVCRQLYRAAHHLKGWSIG